MSEQKKDRFITMATTSKRVHKNYIHLELDASPIILGGNKSLKGGLKK